MILRGKVRWIFYDETGKETEHMPLNANGEVRCLNVEKDQWHSLECLQSDTVLQECKDGMYQPLGEEVIEK